MRSAAVTHYTDITEVGEMGCRILRISIFSVSIYEEADNKLSHMNVDTAAQQTTSQQNIR